MKCKKNSAKALKNLLKFSTMSANLNFAFACIIAEFISLLKAHLLPSHEKRLLVLNLNYHSTRLYKIKQKI